MNWFRRWWRSHYVVLKRFEQAPEPKLFQFGTWAFDEPEHAAHFVIVRLPSFGVGYDLSRDENRWGQRALLYHGRKGFSLIWLFPRENHETAQTSR